MPNRRHSAVTQLYAVDYELRIQGTMAGIGCIRHKHVLLTVQLL